VGASASSIESLLFHDITSQQQQLKTTERERERERERVCTSAALKKRIVAPFTS
jgi:hypothetical protein